MFHIFTHNIKYITCFIKTKFFFVLLVKYFKTNFTFHKFILCHELEPLTTIFFTVNIQHISQQDNTFIHENPNSMDREKLF